MDNIFYLIVLAENWNMFLINSFDLRVIIVALKLIQNFLKSFFSFVNRNIIFCVFIWMDTINNSFTIWRGEEEVVGRSAEVAEAEVTEGVVEMRIKPGHMKQVD